MSKMICELDILHIMGTEAEQMREFPEKDKERARKRYSCEKKARSRKAKITKRNKTKSARKYKGADPRKADKFNVIWVCNMATGETWAEYHKAPIKSRKQKNKII